MTVKSVAKKVGMTENHINFILEEMGLEGFGEDMLEEEKLQLIVQGHEQLEAGSNISAWHVPFDRVPFLFPSSCLA